MLPTQLPSLLRLELLPVLVLLLPGRSRPTQIMPCCMANTMSCISVLILSPCGLPELVKPAAILSFHPSRAHTAEDASMNCLNCAEALPMYVGQPKMIAFAASSLPQLSAISV